MFTKYISAKSFSSIRFSRANTNHNIRRTNVQYIKYKSEQPFISDVTMQHTHTHTHTNTTLKDLDESQSF